MNMLRYLRMQQDGIMMIMISLRIHCDLTAQLWRFRFHYVGISHAIALVKTFHKRWRMPRTWPNLVEMQDDIKKNVSDSTTNLCELKTMGYIVSS